MITFSIITATYDAAVTLSSCLGSVYAQTVAAEHLLIDGASRDGTLDVAGRYPHIARIVSEPDRGIYDAMNKGLRLATGDVIGILNADDFYADNYVLERVAKVFEDPSVEACYGDLVYIADRRPNAPVSSPPPVIRYWRSGPFRPESFYHGWMPPHPTFFVRRQVYGRFGLFNLDLGSAADYELMLRLLLKYRLRVVYIPEILVCMRLGGVSNASVKNRLKANRMDRKAWQVNGLTPYPWTLWMKPVRKIPQYLFRPQRLRYAERLTE